MYFSYYSLLPAHLQVCIKNEYLQYTLSSPHIYTRDMLKMWPIHIKRLAQLASLVGNYVHAWYIQLIIYQVHPYLLLLQ